MKLVTITDPDAPQLEVYTKLNETQLKHYFEPDGGIFIAESRGVIDLALNAGYTPISAVTVLNDVGNCDVLSRLGDIPIYTISEAVMKKINGFHLVRGMMCAMHRSNLPSIDVLIHNCKRIAVLDNVQNPTNVGAVMRSAAAMHMDAVVLTHGCADPLYRRAARVSMGTVFQIPWTVMGKSDSANYLRILNDIGFKTAAMALTDNSLSIDEPALCDIDRLAIVLGSEGYGLPEDTIDRCDYAVRIPMSHEVDSLNVAAAAAVAFWQLRKK